VNYSIGLNLRRAYALIMVSHSKVFSTYALKLRRRMKMRIKTSELQGETLDRAVAHCAEWSKKFPIFTDGKPMSKGNYTTDWALGGPIIEREKIGVWWATHYVDEDGVEYGNHWYAEVGCTDENADSRYCGVADGPTPLIAAMRCYVASKLGDEVEVPDESST
jgi:hypothetical protein